MQTIKFTTFGACSAAGSFGPGDILRCDDALAQHLVAEAQCARYVEPAAPRTPADEQPAADVQVEPVAPRVVRRRRSAA